MGPALSLCGEVPPLVPIIAVPAAPCTVVWSTSSTLDVLGPSAVTLGAWLVSLLSHDGTDCGRMASSNLANASSIGGPLSILICLGTISSVEAYVRQQVPVVSITLFIFSAPCDKVDVQLCLSSICDNKRSASLCFDDNSTRYAEQCPRTWRHSSILSCLKILDRLS